MKRPGPSLRIVGSTDPSAAPSDDDLVLAAAAGDTTAFETLVARHEVALKRFCRSIVGDEEAARDAAQETFVKLWRARLRYRAEGRFLGFLFTLARNTARSTVRRRVVRSWFGLDEVPSAAPGERLDRQETTALVQGALARLPENLRTPLVLRFIEELSYDDIAEVIGRTPTAARSRVHYGLKALEALLPQEVRP